MEKIFDLEKYEKSKVISKLGQIMKGHSSVESSEYVLFAKEINGRLVYQEYLVITYVGGAKACRNININSHTANLQEFARLVNGGYYEELDEFKWYEENWAHCHFMTDGSITFIYKDRLTKEEPKEDEGEDIGLTMFDTF